MEVLIQDFYKKRKKEKKKICINMNYILKINSHYVCSREFNLSVSVSYSDIRDAALDEMVADFMAGE